MAKKAATKKARSAKMQEVKEEHYEYIRAIISGPDLRWEYRIKGRAAEGRMSHDEDISLFDESDIKKLTKSMLDVDNGDPVDIEICYN